MTTGKAVNYEYDSLGRLIHSYQTCNGTVLQRTEHTYDKQGQLTSETYGGTTYTYTYDTYGNIRSASDGTTSHTYTYGNGTWLDLLTAYDGKSISYDMVGNPLSYYNGSRWTFTWENGRQLTAASKSGTTISYTYDVAGIRDSKTVNGTTYTYLTQNGQVVRQTWGSNTMDFVYDNTGKPYACVYNGNTYYYVLNLQGDVIGIIDPLNSGSYAAKYSYDAWGNLVSSSGWLANTNPIRYRGYYYDTESGLYYLGSRYYDPVVKRFINADNASLITANSYGLTEKNLFSYCDNSPISRQDDGGTSWKVVAIGAAVGGITGAFWGGITAAATGDSIATGILSGAASGAISGGIAAAAAEKETITIATKAVIGAVSGGVIAAGAYILAGNANIAGTISAAVTGAASGALSAVVPEGYGTLANAVVTHFSSGVSNIATMISSTVYKAKKCKNTSAILVRNRTNRRNISASAKRTARNRNYRYRYSKRSTV